jgi:hypothetical protein
MSLAETAHLNLVQLFLPLRDNSGQPFPREHFATVAAEITERFGGMTAYARSPAIGLWKEAGEEPTKRDELIVYEVMAGELDVEWWQSYRLSLEERFRQESIVVRSQEIRLL